MLNRKQFKFNTRKVTALALLLFGSLPPCFADVDLHGPLTPQSDVMTSPSDSVTIERPSLSALIAITRSADPFGLDSQSSRPITLDEAAHLAIYNNLDIGVSGLNEQARKTLFLASLGKFLPDLNLSYNYNYLKGHADLPFVGFGAGGLHFNNPVIITGSVLTYHAFRGGSILYGALESKANYRAAQQSKKATVNDTLLQTAKDYYELLLQEALLAVRITAVQTSEELLKQNKDLRAGGLATALDVYQAETQLSSDRQNLIDQQINRRNAAIKLAQLLNADQSTDLVAATNQLQKIRLVSEQLRPVNLLGIAIDHRPELKQYKELRLAAKREINVALAKLLPTFDLTGGVYGVGETLSPATRTATVSGLAVGPGGSSVITAPITIHEDRRISAIGFIGYKLNWEFTGMGTVEAANTHYAKLLARQAQLQEQKVLNQVIADVRQSYLNTLGSENKINETTIQVNSATEELRLAKLRFQYGLGKNIDVLRAQQDFTSALIAKAQAIAYFNVYQAQLLRDLGVLSTATLTARTPFNG